MRSSLPVVIGWSIRIRCFEGEGICASVVMMD